MTGSRVVRYVIVFVVIDIINFFAVNQKQETTNKPAKIFIKIAVIDFRKSITPESLKVDPMSILSTY